MRTADTKICVKNGTVSIKVNGEENRVKSFLCIEITSR
jgi:hypothetical protein